VINGKLEKLVLGITETNALVNGKLEKFIKTSTGLAR
jgi:hypothetical protein